MIFASPATLRGADALFHARCAAAKLLFHDRTTDRDVLATRLHKVRAKFPGVLLDLPDTVLVERAVEHVQQLVMGTLCGLDPRGRAKRRLYFIQAAGQSETAPIRIGLSRDVQRTLAALQRGNPQKLQLIATAPGTWRVERYFKDKFKAVAVADGWFAPTADLLAHIEQIIAGHDTPKEHDACT